MSLSYRETWIPPGLPDGLSLVDNFGGKQQWPQYLLALVQQSDEVFDLTCEADLPYSRLSPMRCTIRAMTATKHTYYMLNAVHDAATKYGGGTLETWFEWSCQQVDPAIIGSAYGAFSEAVSRQQLPLRREVAQYLDSVLDLASLARSPILDVLRAAVGQVLLRVLSQHGEWRRTLADGRPLYEVSVSEMNKLLARMLWRIRHRSYFDAPLYVYYAPAPTDIVVTSGMTGAIINVPVILQGLVSPELQFAREVVSPLIDGTYVPRALLYGSMDQVTSNVARWRREANLSWCCLRLPSSLVADLEWLGEPTWSHDVAPHEGSPEGETYVVYTFR